MKQEEFEVEDLTEDEINFIIAYRKSEFKDAVRKLLEVDEPANIDP